MCKITSFAYLKHEKTTKNVPDIKVIECDRQNLVSFNFKPVNTLACPNILGCTATLIVVVAHRKANSNVMTA